MKHLLAVLALAATLTGVAQNVCSIITNPGEDASRSMRISWAADAPGTCVKFFPASTPERKVTKCPETEFRCTTFDGVYSKAPDNADITEHAVFTKCGATLSGLLPDTEYAYAICNSAGEAVSGMHRFRTAGAKSWSCCVISDFHAYTPLQHRQDVAMQMLGTVEQYRNDVDWTLHLGDVTAWGASWSFWQKLYSEPAFSRMMWAGLIGNHDYMGRKYLRRSNEYFHQANYLPENGYRGEWGVCYHFRYGDVMFVMLDNENMRSDDGLARAQAWVRKVVTEARSGAQPPRYVVVCEHYQWFYGGDGKTSQYARWCQLFDELNIDLALSGNNHIYVRSCAVKGGVPTDGLSGTVYVQTPSSDDERGQTMKPQLAENHSLIMRRWTEGAATVGALHMHVDERCITLTLLNRRGETLDTAVIPAKK